MLKSLSAKIIAATVLLITISYSADFLIASSINATLSEETESLTTRMQGAIEEKDQLIGSLLNEGLTTAENKLEADHARAAAENTLNTENTRKFLEGTRNGIATSSLTLIRNSMMMGEAASAQDMMDTLLDNPDIFAINLWRTSGELSFRDNKTIDEINELAGDEVFEPRDPEEPILIEAGGRADTLAKVVESHQSGLITTGEIETDDGNMEPVEYAYYLMENEEDCQGCHGENTVPRGVLEVAVSRAALIELEKSAQAKMVQMEQMQVEEKQKLEQENAQKSNDVTRMTEAVSADVAEGQKHVADAQSSASTWSIITKAAFYVLIIGVLFWVLNLFLTKPVNAMTSAMGRLADGDLEVSIPGAGNEDEIGKMASAVQIFKENAIEVKRLEAEQAEQERIADEKKRQMMLVMANDFEASVGGVVGTVSSAATEMQASATSLSGTAEQTSNQSNLVASAAEEASTNVQTVASAAEELSSSISEISRQVAQSTQIASAAVHEVDGANQKVQGLADAANKIGEVVALITDIADQTNLLALNATIEAARAGEAGKGFAVVASEVKNLANQTAKATEEISTQISGIQSATTQAVDAIHSIGGTINNINEITSAIAAAVEEQGAATQEIARNVEQAAAGTSEVSSNITNVNHAASETGESAQELLSAASELSVQSETLRSEVDRFLVNIRADATQQEVDFIQWDDSMLVGNEFQDREHKQLIDLINELYRAVQKNLGREALGTILDKIEGYTIDHFEAEEKAMDAKGYPHAAEHKAQHAELITNIQKHVDDFKSGKTEIGPEVMSFLRTWLKDHFAETDTDLAEWLAQQA